MPKLDDPHMNMSDQEVQNKIKGSFILDQCWWVYSPNLFVTSISSCTFGPRRMKFLKVMRLKIIHV